MLPLFWLALAFSLGILIAHTLTASIWAWVLIALISLCLFILTQIFSSKIPDLIRFQNTQRIAAGLLLVFLAAGGLRVILAQKWIQKDSLALYNDSGEYTLVGIVDQTPDRRATATYLHISATQIFDPARMAYIPIQGAVLMQTDAGVEWQLGDKLRFSANPQTPKDGADFSYRDYLERQGIYTVIYHPTSVVRISSRNAPWWKMAMNWLQQRANTAIFALFPQPESGLLAGILLGNDNRLPQAVTQAYQDTGTAHIIAISGFNMAILASLILAFTSKFFKRFWATLLSVLIIALYASFVGGSPSVVRAAVMAGVAYFGHLVGRKGGSLNALGGTALVMLLINPLLLWDASFQLSFAASLGLILFSEPMQGWLGKLLNHQMDEKTSARTSGILADIFLFSIAAQFTTLPVIVMQFKRLSLSALLANPLVLPIQDAALIGGAAATLAGMVWLPLGKALGIFVWPLLAYTNRMVEALASIPHGAISVSGRMAVWISVGGIFLLMLAVIKIYWQKLFHRIGFATLALLLAAAAATMWSVVLRQPDGNLHIGLLRADTGEALLLTSPSGTTFLIDPSGNTDTLASSLSQSLSPWNFHVDAAILTRRGSIKALSALNEQLPIQQVIVTTALFNSTDTQSAVTLPQGSSVKELASGESIEGADQSSITPLNDANGGTALYITYGQLRVLIPNGASPAILHARFNELNGLSLLVLNEDDLANLPLDMWQDYGAQTILWNSVTLPPNSDWLSLSTHKSIELSSDGNGYSLSTN